ncbi:hypothetical protein GN956_G4399 [Arapaima gigas]
MADGVVRFQQEPLQPHPPMGFTASDRGEEGGFHLLCSMLSGGDLPPGRRRPPFCHCADDAPSESRAQFLTFHLLVSVEVGGAVRCCPFAAVTPSDPGLGKPAEKCPVTHLRGSVLAVGVYLFDPSPKKVVTSELWSMEYEALGEADVMQEDLKRTWRYRDAELVTQEEQRGGDVEEEEQQTETLGGYLRK